MRDDARVKIDNPVNRDATKKNDEKLVLDDTLRDHWLIREN